MRGQDETYQQVGSIYVSVYLSRGWRWALEVEGGGGDRKRRRGRSEILSGWEFNIQILHPTYFEVVEKEIKIAMIIHFICLTLA